MIWVMTDLWIIHTDHIATIFYDIWHARRTVDAAALYTGCNI